ncbi:MAG TPA: MarR family transcriptional regulator [Acidimicrobiia bacterium]|nr:MarR family transcriptional regulator [Acidimicrobiia bacterium]
MVSPDWDIDDDGQVVGRALAFTGKVVAARFEETMARAGGSLPTWMVLLTLDRAGPVSQRELARRIHVEDATVTYHVDRLESAGLVSRTRDPADRRVWRVELTPDGTETFTRMKQAALRFETALRRGLGRDELAQFFTTLERLNANAEAFVPGTVPPDGSGRSE